MSSSKGTQTTEHAALATKGMPSTMDKWAKGLKQIPEHWWMNTSDIQSFIVFEGRLLDDLDDFPIISKHPPLIYDVSWIGGSRWKRHRRATPVGQCSFDVFGGSALRSVPEVQLVELALPMPTVPTPWASMNFALNCAGDPNSGIQCLKGQVWRLSRDANGCRVVQEALELGSRDVTDLANELQGHCARSSDVSVCQLCGAEGGVTLIRGRQ